MLRYNVLACTILLLLSSCQKYLDVKPKGKLIPTSIADFNHLLDNEDIVRNPFLDNNSASMIAFLTDNLTISEAIAQTQFLSGAQSPGPYYGYIFREPYLNPNLTDYFWEWGTYRSVKYFNNVIDGIKALPQAANAAEANEVLAQAYTGRAWIYFNTALVYGPVYHPGGDNSKKIIPYVVSSDIQTPMVNLSSQEEVFAKVLSDLHTALPGSPEVTSYPSRPNKTATLAMLAYYHLFTRQFDSVAYYANQAWILASAKGVDQVLYDYNTLYFANPSRPPQNDMVKSPDGKLSVPASKEILLFRSSDRFIGYDQSAYPSADFLALFDRKTDLRAKFFLIDAPGYQTTYQGTNYDDGIRTQYYRGQKTMLTSGFTYPELLLMRAEGYARTNRLQEAMNDLNLLRKYRYVTGTPDWQMPGSQEEVINLVLQERRRELPLGHIKRFLDLKRYVLDAGKPWSKNKITHVVGQQVYNADIDSHFFQFPISNNILKFNPQWNVPLEQRIY
ncbi:RagB/SusD family nutrient uptake outer membrane protein [Chitinophaga arvensicola]|uniref:SusD family protein n=1 Tax=Chitinophaga arvensicola TaxID=29529 RepID=A0A1I0RAI7_9BACT|nr:RagB/SusD family nutrient uptake outer membrane protein [Chitinophaga arvensicola]SEW37842.1 SusD family protein [Chitinophaga arvensicola]